MTTHTSALDNQLHSEITRCVELLEGYLDIGPTGFFGLVNIVGDLHIALEALTDPHDEQLKKLAIERLKGSS